MTLLVQKLHTSSLNELSSLTDTGLLIARIGRGGDKGWLRMALSDSVCFLLNNNFVYLQIKPSHHDHNTRETFHAHSSNSPQCQAQVRGTCAGIATADK